MTEMKTASGKPPPGRVGLTRKLVNLVLDPDPKVRARAIEQAAKVEDSRIADLALHAIPKETHPTLRVELIKLVEQRGTDRHAVKLCALIHDKSALVRRQVLATIDRMGPEALKWTLVFGISDKDKQIRKFAASRIVASGGDKFVALIKKMLTVTNKAAQMAAIKAAGNFMAPGTTEILESYIEHEDEKMAAAAMEGLKRLAKKGDPRAARLLNMSPAHSPEPEPSADSAPPPGATIPQTDSGSPGTSPSITRPESTSIAPPATDTTYAPGSENMDSLPSPGESTGQSNDIPLKTTSSIPSPLMKSVIYYSYFLGGIGLLVGTVLLSSVHRTGIDFPALFLGLGILYIIQGRALQNRKRWARLSFIVLSVTQLSIPVVPALIALVVLIVLFSKEAKSYFSG